MIRPIYSHHETIGGETVRVLEGYEADEATKAAATIVYGTKPDTDRELLVLAAKAIGATEYGGPDDCRGPGIVLLNGLPTHYEGHGEFGYKWDPLTDDGDALRLAVACGVSFGRDAETGRPRVVWFIGCQMHSFVMPKDQPMVIPSNQNDWVRLAILRAAAEIGRAMP